MILPIGDQPNPRGVPWINYALLAANTAVFVLVTLPLMGSAPDLEDPLTLRYLQGLLAANPGVDPEALARHVMASLSAYDVFLMRWGYRAGDPALLSLLTSMFLHGGWMHLLGNMLFLWIYGDNVEHRLGRAGYLLAYLGSGALAAVTYGAFAPAASAHVPMVGASGAISGVLGFYFIWFPRNQVRLLVVLFPFFFDVWLVGARWVLGFYILVENLFPFLFTSQEGGGVAYGAHIGGFIAGLLGALGERSFSRFWCRRKALGCGEEEAPSAGSGGAPPAGPGAGPGAVMAAYQANRPEEAVRTYLQLPRPERAQVPLPLVVAVADWMAGSGQADAALAVYQQLLRDRPRDPELARVFLGLGLTLLHHKGRPTAAYPFLLDALDADPGPEVAASARQALAEIARLQKLPVRGRRS